MDNSYQQEIERLSQKIIAQNNELAMLRNSRSRRITAPLHILRHRVKEKPVIWLLATHDYGNLGDHLISVEIQHFLKTFFPGLTVEEVSCRQYLENRSRLLCEVRTGDIIIAPGGGYIGDTYLPFVETYVRDFIQCFHNNQCIIFPQSLYYTDTAAGRTEKENTSRIFDGHPDLTLVLRDENAYREAKGIFTHTKLSLAPNIALYSDGYRSSCKRAEIALLLMRQDVETKLDKEDREKIASLAYRYANSLEYTDTQQDHFIEIKNRKTEVGQILEQIATSKFLITDRLHGMLLAAITSTPCVAFDNSYGKVSGQYQKWMSHLPYIQVASRVDELQEKLEAVLSIKEPRYSREKLMPYFKQLAALFKV